MVEKLGNFKYDADVQDGVKRVLKEMQIIEGGGSYFGFWYIQYSKNLGTRKLM